MRNEERKRIDQGKRLAEARQAAGYKSSRAAALDNGWPESSYRAHEAGTRTIGQDDAERYTRRFRALGGLAKASDILFGTGDPAASDRTEIPVMGRIGAGAEILPEFEQVPHDGLFQVELPFPVPDDIIGLEVEGDSMLPKYEAGDVVLVRREQMRATEDLLGATAAVRTSEGRRYLKRVARGSRRHLYDLESWNAKTIPDVKIEWASEVYASVPRGQLMQIERQARAAAKRRQANRDRETEGMEELPLKATF